MEEYESQAQIGLKSKLSFHHFRNKKNKGSKGLLVLINIGGSQSLGASVAIMRPSRKQCMCVQLKSPVGSGCRAVATEDHGASRTLRIHDSPSTPQVVSRPGKKTHLQLELKAHISGVGNHALCGCSSCLLGNGAFKLFLKICTCLLPQCVTHFQRLIQ